MYCRHPELLIVDGDLTSPRVRIPGFRPVEKGPPFDWVLPVRGNDVPTQRRITEAAAAAAARCLVMIATRRPRGHWAPHLTIQSVTGWKMTGLLLALVVSIMSIHIRSTEYACTYLHGVCAYMYTTMCSVLHVHLSLFCDSHFHLPPFLCPGRQFSCTDCVALDTQITIRRTNPPQQPGKDLPATNHSLDLDLLGLDSRHSSREPQE